MTTFILTSSSQDELPAAPSLSLLPFALGPASRPLATTTAPISTYFKPRPCPPDVPGIQAGTSIAAFRGRQVAGQTIDVPPGYKGYIVRTSRPHEVSTFRQSEAGPSGSQWPPTPSTSADSSEPKSSLSSAEVGQSPRRSSRRSNSISNIAAVIKGKVKGAGQVAFSKPKTRQPGRKETKKRFRLDSDDDEEDSGGHDERESKVLPESSVSLQTPSKRARSTRRTPKKATSRSPSPVPDPSLPSIIIQEATPLKEPQPTPLRRLGKRSRPEDGMPPSPTRAPLKPSSSAGSTATLVDDALDADAEAEVFDVKPQRPVLRRNSTEQVIPSPATENDPPDFAVVTPAREQSPQDALSENAGAEADERSTIKRELKQDDPTAADEYDGPTRMLKAVSTFSSFTLWTPDGPLAGFRPDELIDGQSVTAVEGPEGTAVPVAVDEAQVSENSNAPIEKEGGTHLTKEEAEAAEAAREGGSSGGVKLRPSWWRTGGAGEGGDEVVRALGEWLGLVECVSDSPRFLPLDLS